MRDWTRFEEAKRLRNTGMTLKAVGEQMGVSASVVTNMLRHLNNRDRRIASDAEVKVKYDKESAGFWYAGLTQRTRFELERRGFKSRDDCAALAAEILPMWRGRVLMAEAVNNAFLRNSRDGSLPLTVVNEVRKWLGITAYTYKQKEPTTAELNRARAMLERKGYVVQPPC